MTKKVRRRYRGSIEPTFIGTDYPEIKNKSDALEKYILEHKIKTSYECPICKGTYYGLDKYHHSCSNCFNCGKPFEGYGKNPVQRSNPFDRLKAFHNTCVRCHKPPMKSLLKEFGF